MSVGSGGRDENAVRALRAASERRWQARRRRRALIAKTGLCFVVPALCLTVGATLIPRPKSPRSSVRPAPQAPLQPPLLTPLPAPVCPVFDGLDDEQRADAIAREFRTLRASSPRAPGAKAGCKTCKPDVDTQSALNAIFHRYDRCHRAAPSARGEVVVKTVVAPDGRVTSTRVVEAQPEAASTANCYAAAVATAELPRSQGFTFEMTFHPGAYGTPSGCPETVTAQRRRLLREAMEHVSKTCEGARGLEVCAPRRFARTFAAQLPIFERDRAITVWRWFGALVDGDPGAIYGFAWLRHRAALPALRQQMMNEWVYESPVPFETRRRRLAALAMAMEHISRLPLPLAFKLTPGDRRAMRDVTRVERYDGCNVPSERAVARWLLHLLDGVPMRDPARDISPDVRASCK